MYKTSSRSVSVSEDNRSRIIGKRRQQWCRVSSDTCLLGSVGFRATRAWFQILGLGLATQPVQARFTRSISSFGAVKPLVKPSVKQSGQWLNMSLGIIMSRILFTLFYFISKYCFNRGTEL
ncbi:hypothetical protein Hanom_Chr17g01552141 [Helianthus anomalus]